MKNCSCGHPVRMGGERVRVNRKNGVMHRIVHMADSTPPCVPGDWTCIMFKPYPKNEADKAWYQMRERWDAT